MTPAQSATLAEWTKRMEDAGSPLGAPVVKTVSRGRVLVVWKAPHRRFSLSIWENGGGEWLTTKMAGVGPRKVQRGHIRTNGAALVETFRFIVREAKEATKS